MTQLLAGLVVPLVVMCAAAGCGGGRKAGNASRATATSCAKRLEGGSWRAVEWKHAAGRGAPEVAGEFYMANASTVYEAGTWETFLDGRAEGDGVARVWGGPYQVTDERGDTCTIRLSSLEEPHTPMGPLPIRFLGPDRFEVVDPSPDGRVVFERNRARDAAWLRAEASRTRREPAPPDAEELPDHDLYVGTGAVEWK